MRVKNKVLKIYLFKLKNIERLQNKQYLEKFYQDYEKDIVFKDDEER